MFRTLATCIGIIVVVGIIFPVFLLVVPPLAWFYGRVMTYVRCIGQIQTWLTFGATGITSTLLVSSNGWTQSPDPQSSLGSLNPSLASPPFVPSARKTPS